MDTLAGFMRSPIRPDVYYANERQADDRYYRRLDHEDRQARRLIAAMPKGLIESLTSAWLRGWRPD